MGPRRFTLPEHPEKGMTMGDARKPQDHRTKNDPRAMKRVKIGGKSRLFRFDANAIVELSDQTGIEDVEETINAASNLNFRVLRAMVWAGLLHDEPDLELRDVGSWIGDGHGLVPMVDVIEPVLVAFSAAVGADEDDLAAAAAAAGQDAGQGPTRRGGTGKKSAAQRSVQASATPSSGA